MAATEASGAARLRMMCSHGGRFLPCGPDGAIRYVGGQTRVVVVPRDISFCGLAAKLGEIPAGRIVLVVRYRLADEDDVLVSVTCDEELAHMREEYDRLKATRPSATFRVFFSGVDVQRRAASGRPPLPPKMRRVRTEPALAAPAPAPMRRVQSAQEFARCSRVQPICYCGCNRRHVQLPPMPPKCPRTRAVRAKNLVCRGCSAAAMSKNSRGVGAEGQELAPVVPPAKTTAD